MVSCQFWDSRLESNFRHFLLCNCFLLQGIHLQVCSQYIFLWLEVGMYLSWYPSACSTCWHGARWQIILQQWPVLRSLIPAFLLPWDTNCTLLLFNCFYLVWSVSYSEEIELNKVNSYQIFCFACGKGRKKIFIYAFRHPLLYLCGLQKTSLIWSLIF